MIDRLDILIDRARQVAIATSYSTTHGLPQDFFVVAARNAILALQRAVINEVAEIFSAWQEDSIVANQETYTTPTDIFARHLIYQVHYSPDGSAENYVDLTQSYSREGSCPGTPEQYFHDGLYTYIWPVPQTAAGKIRRRYEKRLDQVDILRGKVASTAGAAPGYTSITLAASPVPDAKLTSGPYDYVTAVAFDGTIKCRNIPIASYNSGTRVLSIETGYAAGTGETISSGNWICLGRSSTTHAQLDNCCEDFMIAYMIRAAEAGRSSVDVNAADSELGRTLASVVETYSQMPAGKKPIPEHRGDW
jgi:hypothetical protein